MHNLIYPIDFISLFVISFLVFSILYEKWSLAVIKMIKYILFGIFVFCCLLTVLEILEKLFENGVVYASDGEELRKVGIIKRIFGWVYSIFKGRKSKDKHEPQSSSPNLSADQNRPPSSSIFSKTWEWIKSWFGLDKATKEKKIKIKAQAEAREQEKKKKLEEEKKEKERVAEQIKMQELEDKVKKMKADEEIIAKREKKRFQDRENRVNLINITLENLHNDLEVIFKQHKYNKKLRNKIISLTIDTVKELRACNLSEERIVKILKHTLAIRLNPHKYRNLDEEKKDTMIDHIYDQYFSTYNVYKQIHHHHRYKEDFKDILNKSQFDTLTFGLMHDKAYHYYLQKCKLFPNKIWNINKRTNLLFLYFVEDGEDMSAGLTGLRNAARWAWFAKMDVMSDKELTADEEDQYNFILEKSPEDLQMFNSKIERYQLTQEEINQCKRLFIERFTKFNCSMRRSFSQAELDLKNKKQNEFFVMYNSFFNTDLLTYD